MLRRIRISVNSPMIPPGQNIRHIGTSYQISKSFRMDDEPDKIIEENINDTTNLKDWFTQVDIENNEVIYARAKYHFNVKGQLSASEWSRVIPIDGRSSGLKLESNILTTPTIDYNIIDDLITIKTSDFLTFSGPGTHTSTTYAITNSDNVPIYKRSQDEDNLTELSTDNILEKGKMYQVQAKHTNSYNVNSNYGKKLLYTGGNALIRFEFDAPEEFVINRNFYYRLKIWITMFKSYTLEIRDEHQKVIQKLENVTKLVNYILPDGLFTYQKYYIYISINLTNETSTVFELAHEFVLKENYIIPNRPLLPYPGKFAQEEDVMTNGIACVTSRELFDKKVINTNYKNNALYLHKEYNGKLQAIKEIYTFEGKLDVDYINIFQLPNHDILVDVCQYSDINQQSTTFFKFEYNSVTLELTYIKSKERMDERYSTSMSNSMVVLDNGEVYYIPAYQTDISDTTNDRGKRVPLTLRKLDIDKMEIEYEVPLPHKVLYNASLFRDMNNEIYYIGGSFHNEYIQAEDKSNHEEYWNIEQKEIYKFKKEDKTWEKVADMPTEWPITAYCLQAHLRCDGKVVIFNASHSGPSKNYQNAMIFNPADNNITVEELNLTTSAPLRNNLIYQNGDIKRITSKKIDPQQTYTYYSDTHTAQADIEDSNVESKDLVVQDGQIVNIEDIYKYESVTINGTGILRWFRPQGITELDNKTLVIFKDTTFDQQDFYNRKYKKVLILDGTRLTIRGNSSFEDLPPRPLPGREDIGDAPTLPITGGQTPPLRQ